MLFQFLLKEIITFEKQQQHIENEFYYVCMVNAYLRQHCGWFGPSLIYHIDPIDISIVSLSQLNHQYVPS